MTSGILKRAGAACVAVAGGVLLIAATIPAQAVTSPGWRQVLSRHYGAAANHSMFGSVVATSKTNIWVLGGTDIQNGYQPSGSPVALHWNGSRWSSAPMPAGVTGTFGPVSAVSASDIWAATMFGGYVLHYNGTRWSVATRLPQPSPFTAGTITGITALSPTNVWVFGVGRGAIGAQGTWHYDGRKWTLWQGNATYLAEGSAVAANDIWAVGGPTVASGGIERFNGHSWRPVTAAAFSGLAVGYVTAFSAKDVWATAGTTRAPFKALLLHFDGSHWSRVAIPWAIEARSAVTSDGHGGLWVAGFNLTSPWYAMHRTRAGTWSRVAITGWMWDVGHVPGTTSELGAGMTFTKTGSNAALWAFGAL